MIAPILAGFAALLHTWTGAVAFAQSQGALETYSPPIDVHGPLPATYTGDPAQPLTVWSPPPAEGGRWAMQLVGEYARNPLALEPEEDGAISHRILGDIVALNLSGWISPLPRLGLALTIPAFPLVTSNPDFDPYDEEPEPLQLSRGLGVVRAAATVAIVGGGEGFGLGLAPWLGIPGPGPALVTDDGISGGALVTAGYRTPRVALDGQGGVARRPPGGLLGAPLRSFVEFQGGAALGVRLVDRLWLRTELRMWSPLGGEPYPKGIDRNFLSMEALGTLSGGFGRSRADRVPHAEASAAPEAADLGAPSSPGWVGLGYGRWLFRGPGAAPARAFLGVGAAGALKLRRSGGPVYLFQIRDADGPVDGARILVGDEQIGATDATGEYRHQGKIPWSDGVAIRSDRHTPTVLTDEHPAGPVPVVLEWRSVKIGAVVTDRDGNPVTAELVARSLDVPDRPEARGAPGALELPPGRYEIQVVADGMATQVREIAISPTGDPPAPIEAVLLPASGDGALAFEILDPEGNPVVGARVLVDGIPVGTTAEGGRISLLGLAPGSHQIEVQHPAFTAGGFTAEVAEQGAVVAPLTLDRVPGTVRVRVRDPSGAPVPDAAVRFIGPVRLPPVAVGPFGERTQVLSPGSWTAIVSSLEYGVQERDVEVTEGRIEPITVDVVFPPLETGTAELHLRVVDPGGTPIEDVAVSLNNRSVGSTSSGGTLRLRGLEPGRRILSLSGEGLIGGDDHAERIELPPGLTEHLAVVRFEAGTVDVTVRGSQGPVPDAQIRFLGATALPPQPVGPTGRHRAKLPPGDWTVAVSSPALGVQQRDLHIDSEPGPLTRIDFVMIPSEGGSAELTIEVTGAERAPIDRAAVEFDGHPVGTTASEGTIHLSGLSPRVHTVRVQAPGHEPHEEEFRLFEGKRTLEIALEARAGVFVRVHYDEVPIADAQVRVMGQTMLPLKPVDSRGEVLFDDIDPGLWLLTASSPTAGVAQQDVEVKQAATVRVDMEMPPLEKDRTDLMVTVIDPNGDAVEHARVLLDGKSLDQTAQGGTVMVRGVTPGTKTLQVEAPDFEPIEGVEIALEPGARHLTFRLAWSTVPVEVQTVTENGEPIDAEVQWIGGPQDVAPVASGIRGRAIAKLVPGDWRVYARAGARDAAGTLRFALGDKPAPIELVLRPTSAEPDGDSVRIRERVQFDFNQATIRPDSSGLLDQVARAVLSQPALAIVEVQGHTDNVGTLTVNQALSQARADAVVAELIARGVPREILLARGYGQTRPVASNETDEGRADNRRVQFVVKERGR